MTTAPPPPPDPLAAEPALAAAVDAQLETLSTGVVELHGRDELRSRLADALRDDRPLRVKAGFDPTAPDLHLGHTVVLMHLRRFQQLGHKVVFLIGDFTARIGDPTGKKEMRPPLSAEAIAANAETYTRQVFKILDREQTEVRFNAEWLLRLDAADMVRLAAQMTVARMLERDDFRKRYQGGLPIGVHEFLYPLVQAYDSVALEADVELGGTDQLFNLLVGRELQRAHGQAPQIVMTLPLLEGLDARLVDGALEGAKMSKSLGNYVGIEEPASDQYGKLMSISDELMWRYWLLVSGEGADEVAAREAAVAAGQEHPMAAKKALARAVVARYHGAAAAEAAAADFDTRFSKREIPADLPEHDVPAGDDGAGLIDVLRTTGLASSGKEARRACAQGAVRIDGERVDDPTHRLPAGFDGVVQVGRRRMARVRVTAG